MSLNLIADQAENSNMMTEGRHMLVFHLCLPNLLQCNHLTMASTLFVGLLTVRCLYFISSLNVHSFFVELSLHACAHPTNHWGYLCSWEGCRSKCHGGGTRCPMRAETTDFIPSLEDWAKTSQND